ncbi:MAG: hypothetical protein VYE22_35815 [Myxococcota bacterium]|nr:hypothetical protein [Myxococcota bacterium]
MTAVRFAWTLLSVLAVMASATGCDCSGPEASECTTNAECAGDDRCIDGRCVPPVAGDDAGPDTGVGPMCAPSRTCGAACCEGTEICGTDEECCEADVLCGGVCCGGADERCVADVCVLDCGEAAPCGEGGAAVCCGAEQACLLGSCVDPGDPCEAPRDCADGEYCEASIGRCLPRVTGSDECEYRPGTGAFELTEEWHWANDPTVLTGHDQVMSAAMVANLNDDDGDGLIDQNDIPDVVFNTFHAGRARPELGGGSPYHADGILRAISGADGSRLWPTADPGYRTHPSLEVAIADVRSDSPGPEIIGCTFDAGATFGTARLTIFSNEGAILHRFDSDPAVVGCGRPAVADMNGDGVAEIVVGNSIAQADGSGVVAAGLDATNAIAVLYDVDGDADLELIGINGVADHDGAVVWSDPLWRGEGGYVAVADVDLDGDPDIVATSTTSHQVTIRDGATGALLAGPLEITPSGNPSIDARVDARRRARPTSDPLTGGGPPTIANFDDDPEPEIALAGGYAYVIFENDLTLKWYLETQDESSRATGSSVFDFEGDGLAEVLYNDEFFFRSFRGPTGDIYLERCNTSGTLTEYPIVVDVDNDDHAEIVLVENNYARSVCDDGTPSTTGVRSFGHPENQWVRTRRIWNQHSYHVTNIEEDGTLPTREAPNWSTAGLNNFRQNVQPDGLFDAPDLVLRDPGASTRECNVETLHLRVRVVNVGRAGAPAGVPVAFYVDGAFVARAETTRPLLPGASEVVEVPFSPAASGTPYAFTAILNDPDHSPLVGLNECRDENNGVGPVSAACPEIL